jgi:hypothetical protein
MTKTNITDLDVSADRVSLRVNGEALAIVKVKEGCNFAWRVEFRDNSLGTSVFANPERALRWITAGRPLPRGDAAPDSKIVAVAGKPQARRPADEVKEPDPEWEVIKREHRHEPIWNGRMSAFQGGTTLLNPALLVRGARPVKGEPDAAKAAPAGRPKAAGTN